MSAMKRQVLALLTALLMIFVFAACGGTKEDPPPATPVPTQMATPAPSPPPATPEGKYILTAYEMNGEDWMDFFLQLGGDDFDPDSLYIEFQDDGKCQVSMEYGPTECTYKLNGDKIKVDIDGNVFEGTFNAKANTVTLGKDEDGYAMEMVFEKKVGSSSTPTPPSPAVGTASAIQEKWNGIWYGYMLSYDYFGAYEGSEDVLLDAFMEVDIDKNGDGTLAIYLGASYGYYSFDELSDYIFVEADIIADEYHFEVTEGQILDDYGNAPLDPSKWWLGLSPTTDERSIVISDIYTDSDGDGFEYMFVFRIYGSLWEDNAGGGTGKRLPPGYAGYIAEVNGGTPVKGVAPEGLPSGGDGLLDITTYRQFKEILDTISNLAFGLGADPVTYEDVVEYFGGIEGRFEEDFDTYANYKWFVADNGGGGMIMFDKEDGNLFYSGYSASEYMTP